LFNLNIQLFKKPTKKDTNINTEFIYIV